MHFNGNFRPWLLSIAWLIVFATASPAAVIVVANYTPEDVTLTIAEPGEKARTHKLAAFNVLPIPVTAPADLTLPTGDKNTIVRVDPATAYALFPDRVKRLRIEEIRMPGKVPERDARPELNPIPRNPVKVPVTILVDDVDPRAEKVWQAETRQRFDEAAAILEAQTGFRFEFSRFDTWKSDVAAKDVWAQLTAFEDAAKVKAGTLAIGFISRNFSDDQKEFGACRGIGSSHVLVREWKPKGEPERLEVLVRCLAIHLGAITSPDPGSAMREKVGDGQALRNGFVIRLDPLNVLALNLLADQRRLGVNSLEGIAAVDRIRLTRVYSAMQQAFPGDPLAVDYLNILEKEVAKAPNPGGKKPPATAGEKARRIEGVRIVLRAVLERAKANTGPSALRGDELTIALLKAAADSAQRLDEADRASAFLIGIGLALDDRNILREDPLTAGAVADVETDAERAERLALLDNPTLANRRDFCRGFAVGCGSGELLAAGAEDYAVGHAAFDLVRPNYAAGFSFPALAAEMAGIAFARRLHEQPEAVFKRLRGKVTVADLIPDTHKLPDCIGPEKFEEKYGSPDDARFKAVLDEIRKRIEGVGVNRP